MAFQAGYVFAVNGKEVVIRHPNDKYLRVAPGNQGDADSQGGTGGLARWIVELQANKSQCKLKSKATGKYLRIKGNAGLDSDNVDVKGVGGNLCVFKIHKQNQNHVVKLESVNQPGKYIAVKQNNEVRVGAGGKWTVLRFFREEAQAKAPQQQQGFVNPYLFAKTNTVVLKHRGGGDGDNFTNFLRVDPNANNNPDHQGGKGLWAQWEADPQNNGNRVRFKSIKTGKYLRIFKGGDTVDVGGGGGDLTVFKVHKSGGGVVKLESVKFPNKYLAVGKQNVIRTGAGGKWCDIKIFRK